MTHQEMLEAALQRPKNYHELTPRRQWEIDKDLGILDWEGPKTDEELQRLLTIPSETCDTRLT
jgi:hypothetical protein